VWALRLVYRDGRKTIENARSVQADDRGEFRMFYMPPGEYFVRASGTVNGTSLAGYYPTGSEIESATLVRVRGGDEIAADMRILPAKTFRISGTVVNTIPELAADPRGFILMPRDRKIDDGSAASILPNLGTDQGNGSFEIRALPGLYDLMPAAGIQPGASNAAGNPHYYTGRVPVEVRDRDVEGIVVTITRGADLAVQVNARLAPSFSLPNMRLGLRPLDMLPSVLTANNLAARALPADGKIEFRGIPEGRYALVIPATTPGVHISDIRQGARSIYDQGVITVNKDVAEPVEVILSANGGRIEGTVEGADKTSSTVRVSLIPDAPRRDNLLFYKRASLVEGRFVFTDLPAGNYKLFAWDGLPAGADENAEFLATYESRGRAVTVRAGIPGPEMALPLIRP